MPLLSGINNSCAKKKKEQKGRKKERKQKYGEPKWLMTASEAKCKHQVAIIHLKQDTLRTQKLLARTN